MILLFEYSGRFFVGLYKISLKYSLIPILAPKPPYLAVPNPIGMATGKPLAVISVLKGSPNDIITQLREFLNNDYGLFEKAKDLQNFLKNKILDEKLTNEEHKSLKILDLSLPISLEKIKKKYKKLVKIFHPDVNENNKLAENHFKEINEAYKILVKKFLKKNI